MKQLLTVLYIGLLFFSCKKDGGNSSGFPPINSGNDKANGASATDFLKADNFKTLVIEIQYMPGMKLNDAAINNAVYFLKTYLNKPNGIKVYQKQIAASGKAKLSVDDAAAIEKANRNMFNNKDTLKTYILVLDADCSQTGVLGIAYRNTSLCIFEKTIRDNSGGIGQAGRVKVESGVLEHEFGHLLGLVNNGTSMVASHEANSKHCNNKNCLMYYEIETTGLISFLDNAVPQLDANCMNDLKNNGAK